MHVTHLEHTQGHDKFYRVFLDRSSALIRYGRRGAAGQVLSETRVVALDRLAAKRNKGYATGFEVSLSVYTGAVDVLSGRPDRTAAMALSAAADAAWAAMVCSGGRGCVTVIADHERATAAMPHLCALVAHPGARFVPSGVRAALVLPQASSLRATALLTAAGIECLGAAAGWDAAPDDVLRAAAGIADGKLALDEVLAAAAAV